MMTPESLRAATDAMELWTKAEWELFRDRMNEHYESEARKLPLTREGAQSVRRLIAMDNDWPFEAETPQQTRMGF